MTSEDKKEQSMLQLERLASEQRPQLSRDLSDDIMLNITSEHQDKEIYSLQLGSGIKYLVGSLLMTNVALVIALAFVVKNQTSASSYNQIASSQFLEGYKTISLQMDTLQAEQLKRSNSHADVLMNLSGSKKLAIAKFLPVLGLNKDNNSKNTTVYLLADELTAKRIALASEEHSVSVSPLNTPQPAVQTIEPHLVALRDPAGRMIAPKISAASTAVLYLSDPDTGREVRHVLKDGKWIKDEIFDVYSF